MYYLIIELTKEIHARKPKLIVNLLSVTKYKIN